MDNISGNIVPLVHLDGNLSSSGDQQTVYRGYSAYQIALQQGFEGSKDEWLRALVGPQGETGVSISDVRLNDNSTLTIILDNGTEFTTGSIKGDKGDKGQKGDKGDKGDTGKGISFVRLNDDYTLTIIFSDGSDYKTHIPIRGEKGQKGNTGQKGDIGIGIESTVLNSDYTLTITFTDGTSYTTPSIRGEKGLKGETGESGVYIGEIEPTDERIKIWIDTSEDVDKSFPIVGVG